MLWVVLLFLCVRSMWGLEERFDIFSKFELRQRRRFSLLGESPLARTRHSSVLGLTSLSWSFTTSFLSVENFTAAVTSRKLTTLYRSVLSFRRVMTMWLWVSVLRCLVSVTDRHLQDRLRNLQWWMFWL